jgi:hypothetical protein
MVLEGIGFEDKDRIQLVQDRAKWRAFVNTVIKFKIKKQGIYLPTGRISVLQIYYMFNADIIKYNIPTRQILLVYMNDS